MFSRTFHGIRSAARLRIRRTVLARLAALALPTALAAACVWGQTPTETPSRLFAEAVSAAQLGQYDAAIRDFNQLLAHEPGNLKAALGLAAAYRKVHNFGAAQHVLDEAHRRHPHSAEPLAMLGDMDIETQDYDHAIAHLHAALALNSGDVGSRVRLAVAYKAKAEFPEALAQLEKVLARDPNNALAYFTRADIESGQNQDEKALQDAEAALRLQPENRRARIQAGKILVRLGQSASAPDAATDCSRAVEILEPLVADRSASSNKSEARADSADDDLLTREQENDSETLYSLSHAYRCAGQDEKAQKTLAEFETASQAERAKKDGQMQAKHLVEQANALALKNDFQGSLDLLKQALEKDPANGPAYSQLAKLYYSSGDLEKAGEAATHALAIDPYQPDFLYVQGKILEAQREPAKALEAFERATIVNPKESDAFFEMGVIYQQQHDRPRALAAFKKAAALSPDDPDYARALAALSAAHP
jgi:tetratricopeptide (TPR) repeat protein